MPATSYAAVSDLVGSGGYLRDPNPNINSAIMNTLLGASSRLIDEICGQYFYDDGQYTKYFDGTGVSHFTTYDHPLFGSSGTIASCIQGATTLTYTASPLAPRPPAIGDIISLDIVGTLIEQVTISNVTGTGPYTLTVGATAHAHATNTVATTIQVQLAYFENQPIAQWVTVLSGDGVTPPSNFFLWPRNRGRIGSAADNAALKPWTGMDISHIPISNTNYLPSSIPGYMTIAVTAHWGWPVVPDLIKDLTCKIAARLWRKRQMGESDGVGAPGIFSPSSMMGLLDGADQAILNKSGLKLIFF